MTKLEVGKTYKTKSGQSVRIIATDVKSENYPILGLLSCQTSFGKNYEEVVSYTLKGISGIDAWSWKSL